MAFSQTSTTPLSPLPYISSDLFREYGLSVLKDRLLREQVSAMKIIEYYSTAQNVTHLPPEVLEIIIQYIQLRRSSRAAQRDLWSCCLVAQEWYAVAVKYLYEAPVILPRNFPEIARTLSPALSSKIRQIGLEKLVKHLDMGMIAYESQKSTTSRLLSRTKSSLRSFVAPAVSFSTTCLAPLSKCSQLRQLDLSRDNYDFKLGRLLASIKDLVYLELLSLPKDCPTFYNPLLGVDQNTWPTNLTYLQFNTNKTDILNPYNFDLLTWLPPKLQALTFNSCSSYGFFEWLHDCPDSQITKLCVRVNGCDGDFNFKSITNPFPELVKVSVPAMTQWGFGAWVYAANGNSWSLTATSDGMKGPQKLEWLVLEESPDFPFSDHIKMSDLERFVENCPRILRIEVPTAYLNVDDFSDHGTNDMNRKLLQRFKEAGEGVKSELSIDEAGVFMTEPKENAGVGLKRSLRYDTNG